DRTGEEGVVMLVLRRKAGEAIVLNGVITIHVLAVEGERVKLGISAPPEVVIVRSELLENQGPNMGTPMGSKVGPGMSSPMNPAARHYRNEPDGSVPGADDGRSPRRDGNGPSGPSGYGARSDARRLNRSRDEVPAPLRPDPLRYG